MSLPQERLRNLYKISLSIQPGQTTAETARQALSTYLEVLDCTAGAVVQRQSESPGQQVNEPVCTIPDQQVHESLQAALECLPEGGVDKSGGSLPITGTTGDGKSYHLLELPGVGVLGLVTSEPLDETVLSALEPLNEKLATIYREKQRTERFEKGHKRYEAMSETIPEPLVSVTFSDGNPVIQSANSAFEETFGYEEQAILGADPNELIVPEEPETKREAKRIDHVARERRPVTEEVQRRTVDGLRDFLFLSVPVEPTTGPREQFGIYIDITDRKERERKLEQLYEVTQDVLTTVDQVTICEQVVQAADGILDLSIAGIHRYDRTRDVLYPVATTNKVTEMFEGEPEPYADKETVVWEVYRSEDPVLIDDLQQFEGKVPGSDTPARSAIIVPLGDYGVFIVSSTERNAFDDADLYFARLLSTTVTVALDRAEREQGLEAVQQITRTSLSVETQREVAEEVIDQIPDVLGFPISAIWAYDTAEDILGPVASTDAARRLLDEIPPFDEDSIAWKVYHEGEIEVVPDLSERTDTHNRDTRLSSEILVPLGDFGLLITGSMATENISQTDTKLLETLRANLEIAFELLDRREEIELIDQIMTRVLRHNIRNDLSVIKGRALMIAEQEEDATGEIAQQIVSKCDNLEGTAQYAREIRQLVSRRGELSTISLRETVERVLKSIESDFPDAEIETSFEATRTVSAHPRFSIAIHRLVENSIEHFEPSRGASTPQVEIDVYEDGQNVVLEVEDNGPGIPQSELDILEQGDETDLEHASGLGLWIIDRVVAYSSAQLEFDSTPQGTTARIVFG